MRIKSNLYLLALLLSFSINNLLAQNDISPRKSQSGKYGYVDNSDSYFLSPKYDKAFSFNDKTARVIVKGKWGLIDKKGNYLAKPKLAYIGWSNDGYFQWNKNNLSLTNTLIPAHNTFYPDQEGTLAYLKNGKWGLITKDGKLLKNEWDSIYHGQGGHFAVFQNDLGWTWINSNNKSPKDKYFNSVKTLSNGLIAAKEKNDKKLRIYNFEGTLMSDSAYRNVEDLNFQYIKARNHNLWYQLNSKAEPISEETYEEIKYVPFNNTMQFLPFSPWVKSNSDFKTVDNFDFSINYKVCEGVFVIIDNDQNFLWRCLDDKKIELESSDTVIYENNFIKIFNQKESEFDLLNGEFKLISINLLDYKVLEDKDILMLCDLNEKWFLKDLNTDENILSNIDSTTQLVDDGEFVLKRNGKSGLYNTKTKKWLLDPLYKNVNRINDTLITAVDTDSIKFFGISTYSKAFAAQQEVLRINDSTIALKSNKDKWTIRYINLNKVILDEYNDIALNNAQTILLKNQKGWSVYSFSLGKYLLKNSYDTISPSNDGYFVVQKGTKNGIVDTTGNFTFQMSNYYSRIFYFSDKRWQVYRNGLSGLIDKNGILKISTQYEDFDQPVFSYIPFKFRSRWGLLDQKERFVLQPLNSKIKVLSENLVQVWKSDKTGIKDMNDKTLIPIEYDQIERTEYGTFIVKSGFKYGFYNSEAQQIRPLSYDGIKQLNEKSIALKKNDYWQVINLKGDLISDKKFKEIYIDSGNLYFKERKSWVMKSLD